MSVALCNPQDDLFLGPPVFRREAPSEHSPYHWSKTFFQVDAGNSPVGVLVESCPDLDSHPHFNDAHGNLTSSGTEGSAPPLPSWSYMEFRPSLNDTQDTSMSLGNADTRLLQAVEDLQELHSRSCLEECVVFDPDTHVYVPDREVIIERHALINHLAERGWTLAPAQSHGVFDRPRSGQQSEGLNALGDDQWWDDVELEAVGPDSNQVERDPPLPEIDDMDKATLPTLEYAASTGTLKLVPPLQTLSDFVAGKDGGVPAQEQVSALGISDLESYLAKAYPDPDLRHEEAGRFPALTNDTALAHKLADTFIKENLSHANAETQQNVRDHLSDHVMVFRM